MTLAYTKWVRTGGSGLDVGAVMTVEASVGAMVGSLVDVDWRFFGVDLRCPLAVDRDLGRYLRTASAVRPGHVAKKFFLIACVQVEIGGLKHARCKNSISCTFVFCSYTLFA
jgi:hypothetical protein